jgi:hypothetical protein
MNNKGRILLVIFFICAGSLLLLMLYPDRASSGPYLDSAHGGQNGTITGVQRTSVSGYAAGNCAHCHEQHASIGGSEPTPTGGPSKYELLADNFSGATANPYVQSDDVCFYCHTTSTYTLQSSAFNNYTYSATFGGCPTTGGNCTTGTIFEAFNLTSYHNLYDVYRFITGLPGAGSHSNFTNFPADSNPCSGCHNVHIAKRSCGKPSGSFDPAISAISKPSDHNNIWGDDSPSERMNSNFTTSYQAPYWYGSTTNYEPANTTTYDGSNLPDYVTFCIDCHNATNTIYSTTLGSNLKTIDWVTTGGDTSTSGDKHGTNSATTNICIDPPYNSTSSCTTSGLGKVLSCTDCHEPHGGPNNFLIRKEVNGGVLSGTVSTGTKDYGYLCRQCHMDDLDYNSTSGTANNWEAVHHCAGDFPYMQKSCSNCHGGSPGRVVCGSPGSGTGGGTLPSGCTPGSSINCDCCHYHGSSVTNATISPVTRRTF